MERRTLLIDVIEDAIDIELVPASKAKLRKLGKEKINSLREALNDFNWGLWADVASPAEDQTVFFAPPSSPIGRSLGSAGRGTGYMHHFNPHAGEMNGLLSWLLVNHDAIAVESGLQYYLDTTHDIHDSENRYSLAVMAILDFYCDISDLLRKGVLLNIPSQQRAKFDPYLHMDLSCLLRHKISDVISFRKECFEAHIDAELSGDALESVLANAAFAEHFLLCDELNVRPILSGENWLRANEAFVDGPLSRKVRPHYHAVQRASAYIPFFNGIQPSEITLLREDDAFVFFRGAVRDLERFSQSEDRTATEVQSYAQDVLADAQSKLKASTKNSNFLNRLQNGWLEASFCIIPNSFVASQIYPPAAWPVWYAALTGGLTLTGVATLKFAADTIKKRPATRRQAGLIAEVRNAVWKN